MSIIDIIKQMFMKTNDNEKPNQLNEDQILILNQFGNEVTYLNPTLKKSTIKKSKFGGVAAFIIDDINHCNYCGNKLDLILELYKDEFPELYFPDNTNYAQVKTCYNSNCPYDENRTIEFFLAYGNTSELKLDKENYNGIVKKAYLNPIKSDEIPFGNNETPEQILYKNNIGIENYENLIGNFTGNIGTKINGEPFSFHQFDIPKCSCGEFKKQILQISSYEPNMHPNDKRSYWEWTASLNVFIAQVGNYHFFVCKKCGIETLEHIWDAV